MARSENHNPGAFKPTRWSLVLRAADHAHPASTAALDELCAAYWYPLYCFARRRGLAAPDAEDATQDFFARLIEKETLARADPERGRLRTFLLTAFQRYLINFDAHRFAQKRGGRLGTLSLDDAESSYHREPADANTPEKIFHRSWALSVLGATLDALAAEWSAGEKAATFETLRPFLGFEQEESGASYESAAARLGQSAGAIRVAVHRLRKRYREILFAQIGETLDEPTPKAVEDEIHALFAALS